MEDREYKVQLGASVVISDVLGVEALADTLGLEHRAEAVRQVVHDGLAVAVIEKMRRLGFCFFVQDWGGGGGIEGVFWRPEEDDPSASRRRVEGTFAEAVRRAAAETLGLGEEATWVEILEVEEANDDAS